MGFHFSFGAFVIALRTVDDPGRIPLMMNRIRMPDLFARFEYNSPCTCFLKSFAAEQAMCGSGQNYAGKSTSGFGNWYDCRSFRNTVRVRDFATSFSSATEAGTGHVQLGEDVGRSYDH